LKLRSSAPGRPLTAQGRGGVPGVSWRAGGAVACATCGSSLSPDATRGFANWLKQCSGTAIRRYPWLSRARQSRRLMPSRKVRTPTGQGRWVTLTRGNPRGKCHREQTADGAATRESAPPGKGWKGCGKERTGVAGDVARRKANPARCKAKQDRRPRPGEVQVGPAQMDGCPRQNPAYRLAKEGPPQGGPLLFARLAEDGGLAGLGPLVF